MASRLHQHHDCSGCQNLYVMFTPAEQVGG